MTNWYDPIPTQAEPLLEAFLGDFQELWDTLMSDHANDSTKLSDMDRGRLISRQVEVFGMTYLLAVLRQQSPEVADAAAEFLAGQWESGDSLGEWMYQWREELAGGGRLSLQIDQP